jgi:DnaJ-class molecular chaperone
MFIDYYKFIGIHPGSNEQMIKDGYSSKLEKLSSDASKKSENEEFLKVLEDAYCILMDVEKRIEYDQLWLTRTASKRNFVSSNLNPTIQYLISSKYQVELNDEVTITWKTTNCDQIILLPFGSVPSEGKILLQIKKPEDLSISIELKVENTVSGAKISRTLSLYNLANAKFSVKQKKTEKENFCGNIFNTIKNWFH